jgi:hypothetical protein
VRNGTRFDVQACSFLPTIQPASAVASRCLGQYDENSLDPAEGIPAKLSCKEIIVRHQPGDQVSYVTDSFLESASTFSPAYIGVKSEKRGIEKWDEPAMNLHFCNGMSRI